MAAREGGGVSLAPVGAAQGAAWRGRQRRLRSLGVLLRCLSRLPWPLRVITRLVLCRRVVDDVREVAQRVDVLESRIACDMDAFKDDVVARLSSLVNSVSELETTSMLFALFSLLSWLLCSHLLISLLCRFLRFLRWALICRCVRVCFCDKDSGLWSGGGYWQVQVCCARSGCTCFSHFSTACELRFRVHG